MRHDSGAFLFITMSGFSASSLLSAPPVFAPKGRAYRVLVVDDMPSIHEDVRKILHNDPLSEESCALENAVFGTPSGSRLELAVVAFEIDSAFDGAEGVQRVREATEANRPYSVAFVDMRMPPGADGLQTILAIWRIDPQIQVVICSAYSDYSWRQIIDATGETDQLVILRKPFENIELLQLAHALAKKWDLHRSAQRQLETLEALVGERTRELEEKQAIFQLILENVTDLIAVVDAAGNRIYNSPSYATVLGYTPEELRSTHALTQIHPDDQPVVRHAVEQARATSRGELVVYRMRHRDGSWRTLESCAGVVRGADGQLAYFVIVARDVTQRRESELKHQLGQKLESIGRLAAGIAHEINTPTQFITDNTRFLADAFRQCVGLLEEYRGLRDSAASGQADGAVRAAAIVKAEAEVEFDYLLTEIPRALQQNLDGLTRVARIVQSLKEFSHPNAPEMAPADLNRALETAISVCRHEWKYVANVVTEFDPHLPLVPCLLDELNQVFLNLLVNAAHTIGEALKSRGEKSGTITVRTSQVNGAAIIEVADTGMGIRPEARGRIFEPFYTTKEVGKGTGQGLAIVHAVIKRHQGAVDFSSKAGRGTTFRVSLPLRRSEPNPVQPVQSD